MPIAPRLRPGRRLVAGLVLAGGALALSAAPASAHASFPSAPTFNGAPNASGGTGASGSTTPYPAATSVTISARVPFEQTTQFAGADDTTVDVKIVVPAGWTTPACGAAKTQVNDASTNMTNQPGTAVSGWTCAVEDAAGHKVLHWHGPQVVAPATAATSAQFFTFTVTTPSPTAQTTYDGTGTTEGFIVDQTYASGEAEHWIPNAAFPGTAPAGATTTVAAGLVRTVSAVGATTSSTSSTSSTSTSSTSTSSTSTTVRASTTSTTAGLPKTGASSRHTAGVALLLIGGGMFAVAGAARRRRTAA